MSQSNLFDQPAAVPAGDGIERGADLSPDGVYRYRLWRRRLGTGPTMLFVALTPSTADATVDDPTLRRCMGFARREGCGAVEIVNLFALRATDPRELSRTSHDPVGAGNDAAILAAANGASIIVAAWGSSIPKRHHDRAAAVRRLLAGRDLFALGLTAGGFPRHPLYLPADAALVVYALTKVLS